MVKANPPTGPPLKFQGRRLYPIEPGLDDWGLNAVQQETYVEQFRRVLEKQNAWREDVHEFFVLRRFLRARTYDLERATKMWTDSLAWRAEHDVDNILQTFYFTEREQFLDAYPQGYHKTDKVGRPVYIQLIGQINLKGIKACTTEERMYKFHVQEYERCLKVILPICSRLHNKQIDQTFGIMDVKGVGLGHLTGEVKKLLGMFTRTDQDNYPECLGHICIINAPAVFRMVWSIIKTMLDPRTQGKVEILGPNYLPAVTKWVDIECIPEFLGGKSAGTLLDDVGPWSNMELVASLGLNVEDLRHGKHPQGFPVLSLPSFGRASSIDRNESGGFLTPTSSVNGVAAVPRASFSAAGGSSPPNSIIGSMTAINAGSATARNSGALAAIPESRTRTLVERIKAIEELIPMQMERLRATTSGGANGADGAASVGGAGVGGTVSTRSAPEGSLLNRVEVLEEALDTLLAAQAVLVAQQAETEARLIAEQTKTQAARRCCCIM